MPDLTALEKLREELGKIRLKIEWEVEQDYGDPQPFLDKTDIDQICKIVGESLNDFEEEADNRARSLLNYLKAELSKERKG